MCVFNVFAGSQRSRGPIPEEAAEKRHGQRLCVFLTVISVSRTENLFRDRHHLGYKEATVAAAAMQQQLIVFSTRLQDLSHPGVLHNLLYAGPASVRRICQKT